MKAIKALWATCIAVIAMSFMAPAMAQQVEATYVLSTGTKDKTYHKVYGFNTVVWAKQATDYRLTRLPSKGGPDNCRNMLSGKADIAYMQLNSYLLCKKQAADKDIYLDMVARLGPEECFYCAVVDGGPIKDEDDFDNDKLDVVVGRLSGGRDTWIDMRNKVKYMAKPTMREGNDAMALAQMGPNMKGAADAVCWVSNPYDLYNNMLKIVNAENSGLKLISVNDRKVNNEDADGFAMYTFRNHDTKPKNGMFSSVNNMELPCLQTVVVYNMDTVDGDFAIELATALKTNPKQFTTAP